MEKTELFFLVWGGLCAAFFFLAGLAFLLTDLSGLFCFYQNGGIYLLRWEKAPIAPDTPENRRKVSRRMGAFLLALDSLFALGLLGVALT
ncbi:MAG: hypothetical protein HFG01_10140 [Oscillibacter sp.]|jgi:hypothetical protein|nr:hypothetical protein [Oscillibacter sp.]